MKYVRYVLFFLVLLFLPMGVFAQAQGELVVQYMVGNATASTHQITGKCNIVNNSNEAVSIADLKIRYYYTPESGVGQVFNCYHALIGSSNVNGSFDTEEGYHFLEISLSGSGSIPAGSETGEIQFAINNSDWSQYDQTNDYSFNESATSFTSWNQVVLFHNSSQVWGENPGGIVTDQDPTVTITGPADNAAFEVGDSITITAQATDDNNVVSVDFYNGPSLLGSATSTPYTYTISNAAAGTYTINVIATDDAGNTGSDSVTFKVDDGSTPDSDLIVQYSTGNTSTITSQITGKINIVNNGTTDVSVSELQVRYYYTLENEVGQSFSCYYAVIGSDNIVPSFGYEGDNYYVELSLGGSAVIPAGGESGQIQFSINNDDWSSYNQSNDHSFNADASSLIDWDHIVLFQNGSVVWGKGPGDIPVTYPPTVSITSPVNGMMYALGDSLTIEADAADSDGTIEKVDFYSGNTLLGTATSAPYTYTIDELTESSYTLRVVATDNDGETGSASVVIYEELEPSEGFRIVAGQLIDANGNPFIMRGVNHAHTWYKDSLSVAIPAIAENGSNTVRIVLSNGEQWTKDDADSVKEIINLCKAHNLITVLEVHDATGYNDTESLNKAADYFIEIKDAIIGEEAYVIVNIANEWFGQWESETWANAYIDVIPRLREAGLTHTLLVDCAGYGQYPTSVHEYGKSVFAADPQANTMFAIHFYEYSGGTEAQVKENIDKTLDQGLALCIGEFGFQHSDGDVAEQAVMDYCQERNVGWLAWSWFGNGGGVEYLDLAANAAATSLSDWGETVVYGTNGLMETSHICSVFGTIVVPRLPKIEITSPVGGDTYTLGSSLTITVDALDVDGTVEEVAFYDGETLLGTATEEPFSFTIDTLTNNSYELTAVATDNEGNSKTSGAVRIYKALGEDEILAEAEDGTLLGTEVASSRAGYSGTGYVTSFDNEGDALQISVDVATEQTYTLTVGYAAPYGPKFTNLYVNGEFNCEVEFQETTDFVEVEAGKILLNAGSNTIEFQLSWGWYEIDYIKLSPASSTIELNVAKELVNPNASDRAKSLHSYLVDIYGKKILSGQQDYSMMNWVDSNIGKRPAVLGCDMIEYSPSRVEHGSTSTEVENAIAWDEAGGIVTFCWHWNAPKDLIDEEGLEWWRGFYTEATTFDIEYAMNNPESEDYQLLVRDIDAIAVELKRLQEADVPVLWRPLHEAEGGWFWWGAKGAEPCIALYKLMYDRLTNYHGLQNLIWVWSSSSAEWYPGNEYVDIIGFDSYPPDGNYNPNVSEFESLVQLVEGKKIVAMTENGPIPDPDQIVSYGAYWSWFCTWANEFLTDGVKNSLEHIQEVYNHDFVITLDELPDLKNYPQ